MAWKNASDNPQVGELAIAAREGSFNRKPATTAPAPRLAVGSGLNDP
jgi:hypothetical protein